MFTGIIEEIGYIEKIISKSYSKQFRINAKKVLSDISPDESISIDGVCVTVTELNKDYFEATVIQETLQKTTLKQKKNKDYVNLERALKMNDRLGGHMVSGHVDDVGKIVTINKKGESSLIEIKIPEKLIKYTIEKGSIAVNGISLTIAKTNKDRITLAIIPHTLENTTLKYLKKESLVNIEVDFMGKYIERILNSDPKKKMNETWLKSMGY
jgi:riboflavin synthase